MALLKRPHRSGPRESPYSLHLRPYARYHSRAGSHAGRLHNSWVSATYLMGSCDTADRRAIAVEAPNNDPFRVAASSLPDRHVLMETKSTASVLLLVRNAATDRDPRRHLERAEYGAGPCFA
jgi:hypothetical protein